MQVFGGDITYLGFNQDNSRFAIGRNDGFQVYCCHASSTADETFRPQYEMRHADGTSVLGLLYERPLIVHVDNPEAKGPLSAAITTPSEAPVVTAATPLWLMRLYNGRMGFKFIDGTQQKFSSRVLSVKLNGSRLIVIFRDSIYIYDINDMKLKHTIKETPDNILGICALNDRYLAYPGSSLDGKVYIYDTISLKSVTDAAGITAHSSPVSCLAISNIADLLATASKKGTVIRVFSIATKKKLFEFRRGLTTNAEINSMSFSADGTMLCVSSDHPTIHVFKLQPPAPIEPAAQGWGPYLLGYIPGATQMGEVLGQERCFARITLPETGFKNLCGFYKHTLPGDAPRNYVVVITSNGFFHKYLVDEDKGGECEKVCSSELPSIPLDASEIKHAPS